MQWTFKIPPSLGGGDFVVREVSVGESEAHMDAVIGSAGADEVKLMRAASTASKLTRRAALVSWKGETVGDGNAREAFFAKLGPRETRLFERAYRAVHELDKEEEAYLLESMAPAGNAAGAGA